MLGKWLGRALLVLFVAAAALWLFGPREPAPLATSFDDTAFDDGVDAYFAAAEARFDDITPGTEKRVVWAGETGTETSVAILYVHGFSATSEEIRPVPDRLAAALGANLVYTRLTGHGRPGAAMGAATVADWMADLAEGLAAARAAGERVVVLSTSTGGTLAAAAAVDPDLSRDVAAMIFVSPNFGVNAPTAPLLTLPAARHWLPLLMGDTRRFTPLNDGQATYWTTEYPSVAVFPMAALVKKVVRRDFSLARMPALFWISDDDQVVRPDITRRIAARWGGPADLRAVTTGPGDDPAAHVIAGDIMSPGQTDAAVEGMLGWLRANGFD